MPRALFIGGKNDGKWIEVQNPTQSVRLPIPPEFQEGSRFGVESYESEILTTGRCEFGFYRLRELSLEEAIRMLFKNYSVPTDALTKSKSGN